MCESDSCQLSESREQAVRAELNRLLESSAFRASKRTREFLEYIVEHTINGPTGALKERSIGRELFQIPQDFDTGRHTIVRVTANEVRKKLAQHYLAENGSPQAVKIGLPPGSYSAEFRWEAAAEEATVETQAAVATAAGAPPVETPRAQKPHVEKQVRERARWLTQRMIASTIAILVVAGPWLYGARL